MFVYHRGLAGWALVQRLAFSENGDDCSGFGNTLALHEDTLVIAAQVYVRASGQNIGGVFVFTRDGTTWSERAAFLERLPTETIDPLGYGWHLCVHSGAIAFSSFSTETVYVYTGSEASWTRQALLPQAGGQGLCLWGGTLVAGTTIYEREGETWIAKQGVAGQGAVTAGYFAYRLMYRDTLVMAGRGSVHGWLRTAAGWRKTNVMPAPGGAGFDLGRDVAVWGEDVGVVPFKMNPD